MLSQPAIVQALAELGTRLAPSERRIFAVAQVRNESDIIERFVRHTLSWADAILVVDHASSDGTGTILRHLRDEGLSVGLLNDNALGKHHADRQTQLASAAARIERAHVIVPLDADEFLVDEAGDNPRRALLSVPREAVRFATWKSYVPIPSDQSGELDVLKRITHRRRHEADPNPKAIIGVDIASQDSFRLSHGVHSVITAGVQIKPTSPHSPFRLAHFPVRSAGQITAKVVINRLAIPFSEERQSDTGIHYEWLQSLVPISSYMSADDLQRAAELYSQDKPSSAPELVADPVKDSSAPLRYTQPGLVDASVLVAACARQIAERLRGGVGHYREETGIRNLISAENEALRGTLARIEDRLRDAGAMGASADAEAAVSALLRAPYGYMALRLLRAARNRIWPRKIATRQSKR